MNEYMAEEKSMIQSKAVFSDNEFSVMSEISENENISQRELSYKLGVSLGTVNVLINKMIKEGLIKMEQVSQKQVMYMLTPIGMLEKAKKTVSYLKGHYRAIYETKEKIKEVFFQLSNEYENIFIYKSDDEISEIMGLAYNEFLDEQKVKNIKLVDKNSLMKEMKEMEPNNFKSVLLYADDSCEQIKEIMKLNKMMMVSLVERL